MSKPKPKTTDIETLAKMQALVASLQTDGKQYVKESQAASKVRKDAEQKQQEAWNLAAKEARELSIAKVVETGKATHLFVDDKLTPSAVTNVQLPSGHTWRVARDFKSFAKYIKENDLPEVISFDFDLGQNQQTGLDCLNHLMGHCLLNKVSKLPEIFCHAPLISQQQLIEARASQYSKLKKTAGFK
jgi:hypothetical protein